MKKKASKLVGFNSIDVSFSVEIKEEELIEEIRKLNLRDEVHGILVQLPLPKHINEEKVLSEVSLEKDVDGFHPLNIGNLTMKGKKNKNLSK